MKIAVISDTHDRTSRVAEAFYWMWYLEQSCRIQLAALAGGVPLAIPSRGTVERTRAQLVRQVGCRGVRMQPDIAQRLTQTGFHLGP